MGSLGVTVSEMITWEQSIETDLSTQAVTLTDVDVTWTSSATVSPRISEPLMVLISLLVPEKTSTISKPSSTDIKQASKEVKQSSSGIQQAIKETSRSTANMISMVTLNGNSWIVGAATFRASVLYMKKHRSK